MNYILVATDSQTGNKIIKGPTTGKDWLVTPQGSWIADEFARNDRVLDVDVYRYCFKEQQMVKTKIYLLSPSWEQLESMPTE